MKKTKEQNQVLLIISDSGDPKTGRFGHNWVMDCPFLSNVTKDVRNDFAKKQVALYKNYGVGEISYEFVEK